MASNFIDVLHRTPAQFLPASRGFIVDYFNNKLKSAIDAATPVKTKTIKVKTLPPWKNERIKLQKEKGGKTKLTMH